MNGNIQIPIPVNEPVRSYAPGTLERRALKARLAELGAERIEIPLIIGGKEVRTGKTCDAVMPHDHGHVLGTWHKAGKDEVTEAIGAAARAHKEWASWSFEDRAAVLLKAGRTAQAEQVYREDLKRFPENGWSLFGLAQALHAQGKHAEAAQLDARFRKAWQGADVTLGASRF